jgi:hypothetical protein
MNHLHLQGMRITLTSNHRYRGIKEGYRSGLEVGVAEELRRLGIPFTYETERLSYLIPARTAKYTPDFILPKAGGVWFLETKGRWVTADRQKHVLIKKQLPDLDLRFLFSNANAKLYKGSKTSYADFCTKNGFAWAHKRIPDEWIDECHKGMSEAK